MKSLSCVQLFATPRTVAYQFPPSIGFSRKEYWSGFPFPSPGDLPDPGIEPRSLALQADALPSELPGKSNPQGIGSKNRINVCVNNCTHFMKTFPPLISIKGFFLPLRILQKPSVGGKIIF